MYIYIYIYICIFYIIFWCLFCWNSKTIAESILFLCCPIVQRTSSNHLHVLGGRGRGEGGLCSDVCWRAQYTTVIVGYQGQRWPAWCGPSMQPKAYEACGLAGPQMLRDASLWTQPRLVRGGTELRLRQHITHNGIFLRLVYFHRKIYCGIFVREGRTEREWHTMHARL